jgi:multidrug efflux system membrane fusion protein
VRSAFQSRRIEVACLLLVALAVGCSKKPGTRTSRVPVETSIAVLRSVPFQLTSVGTVEAIQSADVAAQVGGVITRVAFREGDPVRAGQLLFQIDPRPYHAALDQALAALARDRAQAGAARQEAARSKELFLEKVLSASEWDQTSANAEALTATVRADSATARTARLNLEFASIRAPISGRTGRLLVHEGDYVRAATSNALVTIIQPSPIRVRFTIPEQQVPLLQRYRSPHLRVLIQPGSGGGNATEGKLVFVDQAVDPASGTLLLKGEFPNRDGRLVPGQFVDVSLVLFVAPRALVVPAQAVSMGQQGSYVYVVGADSTATMRLVVVERNQADFAVISSGLTSGEQVVTDGQLRLSPGAKVMIRPPRARTP